MATKKVTEETKMQRKVNNGNAINKKRVEKMEESRKNYGCSNKKK